MATYGFRGRRLFVGLALAVLLGMAGVAWLERTTLLAWVYVRGLARAGDGDRQRWVGLVAGLGEPAVPGLLECLAQPDPAACANARAGLSQMTGTWGVADPRTAALALGLARAFPRLSPVGQGQVLELSARWFSARAAQPTPAPGLLPACTRLAREAAAVTDPDVQASALELCAALLSQAEGDDALISPSRETVRANLRAPAPANRLRAVQLALHPGIDLLDQVVALLNDPAPEVRRAAMLAVGPATQVITEEGLLPSLHDPDPEVRRLCEVALRARGLRPVHLLLGRLLTDPHPGVRRQVLDHLAKAPDLDPGVWLRRLSHDPEDSVRVAALRAMSEQSFVDLGERIQQMVDTDPSPTVRQQARFYRTRPRPSYPAGLYP